MKFWAWEGYNNGGGVKNMRERERELRVVKTELYFKLNNNTIHWDSIYSE